VVGLKYRRGIEFWRFNDSRIAFATRDGPVLSTIVGRVLLMADQSDCVNSTVHTLSANLFVKPFTCLSP